MDQSRARSRSRSARGGRTPRRQSVPPDVRISRASINPFLNFLADYRKSNTQGLSMKDLAQKGAKLWREMSQKEKEPYIRISKEAQIYRKASKGRRKGRKSRRRRRGSKRRSHSSSTEDERSRYRHKEPSKSAREEGDRNCEDTEVKPYSSKQKHDEPVEEVKQPDDVSIDNLIHPRISYDSIRRDYI
ncbi:unnamed protein product [Acanthoscelides obtectus]|uniref:HMG box domain-containing protein n=1 Tax=Acanthoscelides obtectus TaxID=200917 RepID=A0A9P0PAW6_ACAOB|nr:unnamed protein product [Acanthoscelides obtectus]CAH1992068.1 unnamed protein product [Acanthoscelides obtectus]CAK1635201.1 hypothetical protein AOBTE_LOCUS9133 [Acanthoscelides obtectus]CAK1689381.1 hypothetical protein AOBTE_LOCUS37209 [Acanthoscelides obtectus]